MGFGRIAVTAAMLSGASIAPAATVTFDFNASQGGAFVTGAFGSGSFSTVGDSGTFTLTSGLASFDAAGAAGVAFAGGPFALTQTDLTAFTATIDHGALTALAFTTAAFATGSNQTSFAVAGLTPGNFTATIDGTPVTGDLTISSVTAVPEPASWALLIGGCGAIGAALRRRTVRVRFA